MDFAFLSVLVSGHDGVQSILIYKITRISDSLGLELTYGFIIYSTVICSLVIVL